eukprot:137980-Rhodomonas_salina.1
MGVLPRLSRLPVSELRVQGALPAGGPGAGHWQPEEARAARARATDSSSTQLASLELNVP